MSEESMELSTSWVLLDQAKEGEQLSQEIGDTVETSGAQGDSDSDSISIISEGGSFHKEDDDDLLLLATPMIDVCRVEDSNEQTENLQNDEYTESSDEIKTLKSTELIEVEHLQHHSYLTETQLKCFLSFCLSFLLLVTVAMIIQHYINLAYEMNNLYNQIKNIDPSDPPYVRNSWYLTKKSKSKMSYDTEYEVITPTYNEDNDHSERDLKSNFNPSENKEAIREINEENSENIAEMVEEFEAEIAIEQYQEKLKELELKESYLNKKEKFLIKKEHYLRKKEMKYNDAKGDNKNKKNKPKKEEKCSKRDKKKCKIDKRDEEKKRFKKADTKEYCKSSHPSKHKFNEEQRKRNISGQWYINLHRARRDIRDKEHESDWVFDRARLRSTKRNKAHWYFQWMVDRSRHRMK